jgi:hypothetical protein
VPLGVRDPFSRWGLDDEYGALMARKLVQLGKPALLGHEVGDGKIPVCVNHEPVKDESLGLDLHPRNPYLTQIKYRNHGF